VALAARLSEHFRDLGWLAEIACSRDVDGLPRDITEELGSIRGSSEGGVGIAKRHVEQHNMGPPLDEGDANVIAAFATLVSDSPMFQYSGWLSLWLYLRNREVDKLLNAGPRADLERIFKRARAEQIGWINDLQRVALDWFLKANSVEQGVRSYSRVVLLTAGTEPYWERFR